MPETRANQVLGFPPDARLLILNCDDFGMYEAINVAIVQAVQEGIATSCSLMATCPGTPHAFGLLRDHPEIPCGVHLTLICDTTGYGWGPLAPREKVPSLLNEAGELFRDDQTSELMDQARLDHVELEFRAQIETVLTAGVEPTHLDWHCLHDGGRDDVFELTVALASEHGLAVRVSDGPARHTLQERRLPANDHDLLDSFELDLDGKTARYSELLRGLPPGLSEWAVHPGLGDGVSQAIDPGGWQVRRTDYEFLMSAEARALVREEGIELLDYRPLQEVWRGIG